MGPIHPGEHCMKTLGIIAQSYMVVAFSGIVLGYVAMSRIDGAA
jgi:hypothetical protein